MNTFNYKHLIKGEMATWLLFNKFCKLDLKRTVPFQDFNTISKVTRVNSMQTFICLQ